MSRCLGPTKTVNQGLNHPVTVEDIGVEREACVLGEHGKECKLGTAIAFTKWVMALISAMMCARCFAKLTLSTIPGKPGYPLNLIPSGSKNGIGATTARVGTPLMSMLSSVPTAVNGKRRCAVASTLPRE